MNVRTQTKSMAPLPNQTFGLQFTVGFGKYSGYRGNVYHSTKFHQHLLFTQATIQKLPFSSSIKLFCRLHGQNVPVEMHIYAQGEHGFSLERGRGETTTSRVDNWSQRCLEWLRLINML